MADENQKLLMTLLRIGSNSSCADCGSKNEIEWASYNIGIFLCTRCAGCHRSMGAHISKVKHLKLDRWEDSQVERVRDVGNARAKQQFERKVPACYRRPRPGDTLVLTDQWIRAKYDRLEFSVHDHPGYTSGHMDGFLMKKGKEDHRYQPRRFILSETDDTLRYHVKEAREPKAILRVSDLNVAFAPAKMEHTNAMQMSFMKDGSTRHIFLYHDDPETIHNWYMAIRCAKLHRMQILYPHASEEELVELLTRDFTREGWLSKTGPRPSDGYKRRWFTLDGRKLMYHDDPLDAYPKGEIFLGHREDGYSIRVGAQPGAKDQGHSFTLCTPERTYNLSAATEQDRDGWIAVVKRVMEKPLTPLDSAISARLIRKRTGTTSINIFSGKKRNQHKSKERSMCPS